MNNDKLNNALDLINAMHSVFQYPTNREEEDILHLVNAVRWRVKILHAERFGYKMENTHG